MGLDAVEFVIEVEKEFSISIDDSDAPNLGVVGDLARYIVEQSKKQNQIELQFEPVLRKLIDILNKKFAIPIGYVNSTSHVIHDLGLD